MAKYRKAVIVSAWQYNGNFEGCPEWISDAIIKQIIRRKENVNLITVITGEQYDIITVDDCIHLSVGDYIVKCKNGELYPCKPDIFEKTYEEVQ